MGFRFRDEGLGFLAYWDIRGHVRILEGYRGDIRVLEKIMEAPLEGLVVVGNGEAHGERNGNSGF